jgi:imidazolonepropionase-like amidohydrolase
LVRGTRIEAIERNLEEPSACVIDLGDVTLMPGLVDAHTHLLHEIDPIDPHDLHELTEMSDAHRALFGAANARSMLNAGFTTVRDLGNAGHGGDIALRDAILRGWVEGPRMYVATRALAGRGGQYGRLSEAARPLVELEYATVDGPTNARALVRAAIAEGADGIKVIVGSETAVTLSLEEVRAIVDEAHRARHWVAAHATDDVSARIAVDAGVDSIEHGYGISSETLALMAERNIVYVPTDFPDELYHELLRTSNSIPEGNREVFEHAIAAHLAAVRDGIRRAVLANVRIVTGSDTYFAWGTRPRGEVSITMFRAHAALGIPPIEILRSATMHAASLLRVSDRIGELTPERVADIVAVPGDPLTDITTLERVAFVLHEGRVVRNDVNREMCDAR